MVDGGYSNLYTCLSKPALSIWTNNALGIRRLGLGEDDGGGVMLRQMHWNLDSFMVVLVVDGGYSNLYICLSKPALCVGEIIDN